MSDKVQENMDKLAELAKPIQDFLKENYHPHCYVNVGWDRVSVNQVELSVPTKED